jgi:hypothetical protein
MGTNEAEPWSGGAIQIGHSEQANLGIDRNEITARSGGNQATLNLNPHGGRVSVGVATSDAFGQMFVQQQAPQVFAMEVNSSHATFPTIFAANLGDGPALWAQGASDPAERRRHPRGRRRGRLQHRHGRP